LNLYLLFFFKKITKRPKLHDSDHSNVLSAMHGFRDNDVLLPTRYDVIVSPQPGGDSGDFFMTDSDFWKSEHDFLIVIHSNFLSVMHGFWANEALLPTGYDVIVISPLGAFHTGFVDRIWKSDPSFIIMVHWQISCISYRFGLIRHFIVAGNCPFWPMFFHFSFQFKKV